MDMGREISARRVVIASHRVVLLLQTSPHGRFAQRPPFRSPVRDRLIHGTSFENERRSSATTKAGPSDQGRFFAALSAPQDDGPNRMTVQPVLPCPPRP